MNLTGNVQLTSNYFITMSFRISLSHLRGKYQNLLDSVDDTEWDEYFLI